MKQFLLIVILIIGLDQTFGFLLNQLYLRTISGETGGNINGILRRNPDVLVLGSSRARHHVVPLILQERLSASVFNAGLDGHDFLCAIMLLDLWTRSHPPPKVILLHVDPISLLYSKRELARTSIFSGYFRESERVRSILLMRGKYEWLKYLSSSYRFNGKVLPIIKNLAMRSDVTSDGYAGLKGSHQSGALQAADLVESATDHYSDPFWDLKLGYLAEIARYCKVNGTRLFLFHSPRPQEDLSVLADWSKRLTALQSSDEGVEFLDLAARAHEVIDGRPDLFWDKSHLNSKGAEIFSTLLADEISSRLSSIANQRQ
jgi:hypothetical protein